MFRYFPCVVQTIIFSFITTRSNGSNDTPTFRWIGLRCNSGSVHITTYGNLLKSAQVIGNDTRWTLDAHLIRTASIWRVKKDHINKSGQANSYYETGLHGQSDQFTCNKCVRSGSLEMFVFPHHLHL